MVSNCHQPSLCRSPARSQGCWRLSWRADQRPFGPSAVDRFTARPLRASLMVTQRDDLRRSYASSSGWGSVLEQAVEVAGDVAGNAAFDLSAGLAFGGA